MQQNRNFYFKSHFLDVNLIILSHFTWVLNVVSISTIWKLFCDKTIDKLGKRKLKKKTKKINSHLITIQILPLQGKQDLTIAIEFM